MAFPLLIPALVGGLASAMGSFVGRAMLAVGVGFVSYKGIDVAIGSLKNTAIGAVRGLPADALNLLAWLWLDKALTIIFSAVVTALAMRALGGTVKRMVMK